MFQQIIEYFQTPEEHPLQRMALLVGGLLFFWIIEGSIPLLALHYKKTKLRHAAVNVGFTVMHLVIHTFLAIMLIVRAEAALVIIVVSLSCTAYHWGALIVFYPATMITQSVFWLN